MLRCLTNTSLRRRLREFAGLMMLLACADACYRFTPLSTVEAPVGREVRVDLTDAGAVQLAPLIGERIASVDGRTAQASDTALVMIVSATNSRSGRTVHWNGEQIVVPRSAISRFQGKQVDKPRSWMLAGVVVLGAAILDSAFGLGIGLDGLLGGLGNGGRK